jgi:hypothetical protein
MNGSSRCDGQFHPGKGRHCESTGKAILADYIPFVPWACDRRYGDDPEKATHFLFSADEVASTDELTRRNVHEWGQEAEEFESRLKEADEIEKERRRRADRIER